ncbi:MAG TPA: type 1 glutamine amidotransferase [Jatrophihabitantaceae bacterium]
MGDPLLVVQNAADDPIGPLGEWLTAAGLTLDVRDAERGDSLPGALDEFGGLLVLGGGMSADDDERAPWLPVVRALLAEAIAGEVPTLAVCLGAQLLAVALGGRVGPNPDGPEFGAQLVAKRANSATDPLFRDLPITPDVIQWHYDAVLELPPSAALLASSPVCEVQAFRAGRVAWGIQFHIETTPSIVRQWAAEDAAAVDGYDVDAILDRSDTVHADIEETWRPFAEAFAAVVADPSSVPSLRPLRMVTAEPVTDPAAIRAALAAELHAARQPAADPPPDPPSGPR